MSLIPTSTSVPKRARYHSTDAWRGYSMPRLALIGASDTGNEPDSPAPTTEVYAELDEFKRYLREHGIQVRTITTESSNVFMVKRWITANRAEDFPRAAQLAVNYMDEHRDTTTYIHDADLDQLGYRVDHEFEEVLG